MRTWLGLIVNHENKPFGASPSGKHRVELRTVEFKEGQVKSGGLSTTRDRGFFLVKK